VRFQLRRERTKNESLNEESRCQTEWPSDQKPTGALFHVTVGDCSEQYAFGSDENNHAVVRRKTEWHFASRAGPNESSVVAVCEAELTHGACERPPYAHRLLSQFQPSLNSQNSPHCGRTAYRRMRRDSLLHWANCREQAISLITHFVCLTATTKRSYCFTVLRDLRVSNVRQLARWPTPGHAYSFTESWQEPVAGSSSNCRADCG
jgi:hypothetical protein